MLNMDEQFYVRYTILMENPLAIFFAISNLNNIGNLSSQGQKNYLIKPTHELVCEYYGLILCYLWSIMDKEELRYTSKQLYFGV